MKGPFKDSLPGETHSRGCGVMAGNIQEGDLVHIEGIVATISNGGTRMYILGEKEPATVHLPSASANW